MDDQATDWPAAWVNLRKLYDDEWDAEHARLKSLWKNEYHDAYVSYAVSRGWDKGDAEDWCREIVDDAWNAMWASDATPETTARIDVLECEQAAP